MENIDQNKLEKLIKILKHLIDFLEPYKTLLNTHNVQYIVENHWNNESFITKELRSELDGFINEFESTMGRINLIKAYKDFLFSANPDGFKLSLFSQLKECNDLWNGQIIVDADQFLDRLITSSINSNDLIEFNKNLNEKFDIIERQNRFMNEKKSYEVDTMSKFVANLCKKLNINTVSKK